MTTNTSSDINSTILGAIGWTNGSIDYDAAYNLTFPYYEIFFQSYPNATDNQGLSLNLSLDNNASITFPVRNESITFALPLIQQALSNQSFHVGVSCVYPLSSQYDHLTRGLFYLLIIVSVVFRRHAFLATAALGAAMTYAATAAIHLFVLSGKYKLGNTSWDANYGTTSAVEFDDPDILGIYPILSAAGIMITPILNWSSAFRNNQARIVVIYWAVLIFIALIPAWKYSVLYSKFNPDVLASFAVCPVATANIDKTCTMEWLLEHDQRELQRCGCTDFCSSLSPTAPLRRGMNMVLYASTNKLSAKTTEHTSGTRFYSLFYGASFVGLNGFEFLFSINNFITIFVLVHGVLGILESQVTQPEFRNLVFTLLYLEPRDVYILLFEGHRETRTLSSLKQKRRSVKRSVWWKLRWHLARLVATSFFFFAVSFAFLCPFIFVLNVVTWEFYLGRTPVSEHSDAVGAWSTWVNVALVLFAGLVLNYHDRFVSFIGLAIRRTWRYVRYDSKDRRKRNAEDRAIAGHHKESIAIADRLHAPFTHVWNSTKSLWWSLNDSRRAFVVWWKDPVSESRKMRTELEHERRVRMPSTVEACPCAFCIRHEDEEAHKETDTNEGSVFAIRDNFDRRPHLRHMGFGERLIDELERMYRIERPESSLTGIELPIQNKPQPTVNHQRMPSTSVAAGDIDEEEDDSLYAAPSYLIPETGSLPSLPDFTHEYEPRLASASLLPPPHAYARHTYERQGSQSSIRPPDLKSYSPSSETMPTTPPLKIKRKPVYSENWSQDTKALLSDQSAIAGRDLSSD